MFMVREVLNCKPGQVGQLAKKFRIFASMRWKAEHMAVGR